MSGPVDDYRGHPDRGGARHGPRGNLPRPGQRLTVRRDRRPTRAHRRPSRRRHARRDPGPHRANLDHLFAAGGRRRFGRRFPGRCWVGHAGGLPQPVGRTGHHRRVLGRGHRRGAGYRHRSDVDGQPLEDLAGNPVSELGPVIGTVKGNLEDCPPALLNGAGESGDKNVQAGGKPHHRQVNQSADRVITQFPGVGAVGAVPVDSNRGGVDDSGGTRVGGSGKRQADYCRAADSVCDEAATRLQVRSWFGQMQAS